METQLKKNISHIISSVVRIQISQTCVNEPDTVTEQISNFIAVYNLYDKEINTLETGKASL